MTAAMRPRFWYAIVYIALSTVNAAIFSQEKPPLPINSPKPATAPGAVDAVTPAAQPPAGDVPQKPGMPMAPAATPQVPLSEDELRVKKEAELRAERERELAAQKAREEEARRIEAAKTFFDKLLENSKILTGINAGLGQSLNSTHKTGYGFGMTIDYLAYKRYGFHFGAETGIFPTKTQTLGATPSPVAVADGGTFGYLNLNFAAVYALPAFGDFEPAVGLGISIYQLRGGTYDFNQVAAPYAMASIYYNLLSHLQVGFISSLVLPSASKVTSASSEYLLDANATQSTLSLHLSLRYSWF